MHCKDKTWLINIQKIYVKLYLLVYFKNKNNKLWHLN